MKLSKVLIATTLALASAASFADTGGGPLDLSTGSTFFGRTPTGPTFEDTYTFTLSGASFLTGSIDSSEIGGQDVDFTSVVLMFGGAVVATYANLGTDAQEHYVLSQTLLAPGSYSLVIGGLQSAAAGSYAGNLAVMTAAVPEPQTYALLFAGLGLIGFVANRRRQQ